MSVYYYRVIVCHRTMYKKHQDSVTEVSLGFLLPFTLIRQLLFIVTKPLKVLNAFILQHSFKECATVNINQRMY